MRANRHFDSHRILAESVWLLALRQHLQAEHTLDQQEPMPRRLAALLKQLEEGEWQTIPSDRM